MPAVSDLSSSSDVRLKLDKTQACWVLGIGLFLRLIVLWTAIRQFPRGWLFTRGIEMGLLAKSLLAGQGLSSPFGGSTGPTAFIAPIYPILVAIVFRLFGQFSTASAIVIMVAQILLNLVTMWLVMRLALRLSNQRTATLAGLVWACSLPLIWMPTIFWETSLSACMLTGLLLHALRLREIDRVDSWRWAVLGAYVGAMALVNPALLLSAVAVTAWIVFQRRQHAGLRPLLTVLLFCVVFSSWPIRNAKVFHAFIPLRTTLGFELWMGNHQDASGYLEENLFPMYNRQELADYLARGEVDYSANKSRLAKDFICEHPATFLRLTAERAVRFWSGTGTRNGSALFAVHGSVTTLLGVAGLWLLVRRRCYADMILFCLPMALFPLPYIVTHAEFRYRIVIDPLMTVAAAYAATEFYRRFATGSDRKSATASTLLSSADAPAL
jgi:hypothetical protein